MSQEAPASQDSSEISPRPATLPVSAMPPTMHRSVALIVHTSSDWTRQVLRGIAQYASEHGFWDFFIEPRGHDEKLLIPKGWSGDGIIARLTHPALEKQILKSNLPCVNVSWMGQHSLRIPKVVSDEAACGRLAAEHFLEQSFRSFAYIGPIHRAGYDDLLGKNYINTLLQAGHQTSIYQPTVPIPVPDLLTQRKGFLQWLKMLPKPTAIFTWSGEVGRELMTCARLSRFRIPDDIALLVGENDPLLSALAPVPLSNIDQAPVRVGYEAATLLDKLMNGEPAPDEPILVPPVGVVQRRSTETSAVDDPLVDMAVRFMRDHLSEPIQIADVEKALNVSRRVLEHRFHKVLDDTPANVLRRMRLQNVKRLLGETTLPLARIAQLTGFNHVEVLVRTFRRELGVTPGEYRRRH
ncbi:Xylose operon regulatory protein [Planctopirus ephydatiae]|jgi:LacI family transcriptional regulator|uniref:Xylose operon regulatory protein n=1 Tax=Planctopirus ephydatiae TaxID=2528019 RepID=A0A518GIY5_9PLAN|nr:xylose operon transcription regulator XylR [Planctopirus ephydatiae]QDV28556.1 Xylose operon regulatory protein [Planctopirus ephydatiae]